MTLGPFSFAPGLLVALLALFAALGVGKIVARRRGVDAERALWLCASAALLAGRAGFVARWWSVYAEAPMQTLNLRDGGFDAVAGIAAAIACAAFLAWRRQRERPAIGAALAAALLVWAGGQAWSTAREQAGTLPVLSLNAPDGARVDLASLAGQPLVLNLWATWCPPCRREMPLLARAQHDYPEVRFVFVNQGENAAAVDAYLAKAGLTLERILLDPQGRLAHASGSPGLPTTLFFDARGRLVGRRVGELSAATLASYLQAPARPARADRLTVR